MLSTFLDVLNGVQKMVEVKSLNGMKIEAGSENAIILSGK